MDDVGIRLQAAKTLDLDPNVVSPSGTWFAWRPVRLASGKWAWLRRVSWFKPLGLFTEYYEPTRRVED